MTMTSVERLGEVNAAREQLDGHHLLPLTDDSARLILSGRVEVYAQSARHRHFLFDAGPGDLLLASAPGPGGLRLVALGQRAELITVRLSHLPDVQRATTEGDSIALALDRWCHGLGSAIDMEMPAGRFQSLNAGDTRVLRSDEIAHPERGVCWAELTAGSARLLGRMEVAIGEVLPVTQRLWLQSTSSDTVVQAFGSDSVLETDRWAGALERLHRLILEQLAEQIADRDRAEEARLAGKTALEGRLLRESLARMASVAEPARAVDPFAGLAQDDPLLAACQLVGRDLGVDLVVPPPVRPGKQLKDPVAAIAEASRLRYRHVALRGDWWRHDGGPLLAFDQESGRPFALLQPRAGRYEWYDATTRQRGPVTDDFAARLKPFAYSLLPSLTTSALTPRLLWEFATRRSGGDLRTLVLAGMAAGVLGLTAPILARRLFDDVIPLAERSQLLEISLLLVLVAIVAAAFEVTRGIVLLRLEARIETRLESAMMDRLLRLPSRFFKQYQTGDLANRVLSISLIRRMLTGVVLAAVLRGIFSSVNLVLLFFYDARLAAVGLLLAAIAAAVLVLRARAALFFTRQMTQREGRIAGLVYQLMTGIAKLRAAGAERRAFAVWADQFAEQKRLAYQAGAVNNSFDTFNAAYPLTSSIVLFAAVYAIMQKLADPAAATAAAAMGVEALSTGAFIAVITAFSQFLAGFLGMGLAVIGAIQVVPMYERVRPLIEAVPEVPVEADDPGALKGEIELARVSFRYDEQGPLVLDDVSLTVGAGEMVALVGPSGSGKSTLMRLLLGLDRPTGGAIFFDGQDFARLDVAAVRRQIGVVLQKDRLQPGDVFHNIVGHGSNLTLTDAWEAARLAGLEDDIKAMPMGMHTVVSEGGSTFSGGQRQRLLIARAIVHKPRILFFDEATSALDNRTQQVVSESLTQLRVTRIVIAHRLSTIRHADRIYVLSQGKVVESGTYGELAASGGLFSTLIQRQLV